MRSLFLISGVLGILLPYVSARAACDGYEARIEKRIDLPENINYFIRGSGTTGEVGFNSDRGNRILNLATGKMTAVSGAVDPVVSPDGLLLTTVGASCFLPDGKEVPLESLSEPLRKGCSQNVVDLNDSQTSKRIAQFRSAKKPYVRDALSFHLRQKEGSFSTKPVKVERVFGQYQSIGILSQKATDTTYRIYLDAPLGRTIFEYKSNKVTGSFAKLRERRVCANVKGSLPMISRDGKELFVYNYEKRQSEIYEIGFGNCQLKSSLLGLFGKPDFSDDSRKLIAHVDTKGAEIEFPKKPETLNSLKLVMIDRASGKSSPVRTAEGENAYYPIFLDADRIAYIAQKGRISGFSLVTAKLVACSDSGSGAGTSATVPSSGAGTGSAN